VQPFVAHVGQCGVGAAIDGVPDVWSVIWGHGDVDSVIGNLVGSDELDTCFIGHPAYIATEGIGRGFIFEIFPVGEEGDDLRMLCTPYALQSLGDERLACAKKKAIINIALAHETKIAGDGEAFQIIEDVDSEGIYAYRGSDGVVGVDDDFIVGAGEVVLLVGGIF
jgi:hypothetical protein